MKNPKHDIWIGAGLLVLNLILANILVASFSPFRIDLTDGQVFSLSPTTKEIVGNLEETIEIRAYISKPRMIQKSIRPAIPRITDLLEEFAILGKGLVKISAIVPEDDPEAEEEAQKKFRVRPQLGIVRDERQEGIKSFYLSLVVLYPNTDPITLSLQQLITQRFIGGEPIIELKNVELELTKAIKKAVYGFENKRKLFQRFPREMKVTCFVSPKADLPRSLKPAIAKVKEALLDLASQSLGKFSYEFADLANKKKMEAFQVPSIPFPGAEKPIYLWMFAEVDHDLRAMPLFSETGVAEAIEITDMLRAMIREHTPGLLRTIGVAEHRPPANPNDLRIGKQGPPAPFKAMSQELRSEHNVVPINLATLKKVPQEVDVLMVMEPRMMKESAVFAIDQYVMRGGRVIFCLDRSASVPSNPRTLKIESTQSGLEDVLMNWGVTIQNSVLMDDNCGIMWWETRGRTIEAPWFPLPQPGAGSNDVNEDLPFMTSVDALRFWFPSTLKLKQVAGLKATWALKSSRESWTVSPLSLASPNFEKYKVGGYPEARMSRKKKHIIAAAVEGKFSSLWAQNRPTQIGEKDLATVKKESRDTKIVVIANGDFLHSVQSVLARQGPRFSLFDLNMNWVFDVIDWLLEDDDLARIRNRGRQFRGLVRLDDKDKDRIILANLLIPIALLALLGLGLFTVRRLRTGSMSMRKVS